MSKRAEERARQAFPGQFIHDRCVFKFGYEEAEKDLGWHSVDESLPETGKEVIVLVDVRINALNFHLFYRIAFGHIVNEKETVDFDGKPYKPKSHNGWNIPGVKFWMPMPKIPNEKMKAPDKIYVHTGAHLGLLTLTTIPVGGPAEQEFIRKDALLEWAKEKAEDYKGTANIRRSFEMMIRKIESL